MDNQRKIIFVCRGNTCRSAMAKYILRHMLETVGLAENFRVDSAGYKTKGGSPMREGARRALTNGNVPFDRHKSKPFKLQTYNQADLIIVMDTKILSECKKISGGDPDKKIRFLKDADGNNMIVKNPYGSRNYPQSYNKITAGCAELLKELTEVKS